MTLNTKKVVSSRRPGYCRIVWKALHLFNHWVWFLQQVARWTLVAHRKCTETETEIRFHSLRSVYVGEKQEDWSCLFRVVILRLSATAKQRVFQTDFGWNFCNVPYFLSCGSGFRATALMWALLWLAGAGHADIVNVPYLSNLYNLSFHAAKVRAAPLVIRKSKRYEISLLTAMFRHVCSYQGIFRS